jgi:MFS family permease
MKGRTNKIGTAVEEKSVPISDGDMKAPEATWRNLPHKRQLLLVALCRLSTPLSNACLIPYLYFLVKSIIADPEHPTAPQHISRLTGLLVAAFPIGQILTSLLWGRLSDIYGRKPTILLGLAISIVANLGFGFSRTIGMLLFWRLIAGMGNGIVGVMRTMTAEIVKERRHRPRAFLAPPVVFNSGRVIALATGGCLADPVVNMPNFFGPKGTFNFSNHASGVKWAIDYPYALPALFNGLVLMTCLIFAALWLRESLPGCSNFSVSPPVLWRRFLCLVKQRKMRQSTSNYTPIHINHPNLTRRKMTVENLAIGNCPQRWTVWTTELRKVLLAFALLPLHNASFLHIFPVLLSMPTSPHQKPSMLLFSGGLALSSPKVGLFLAVFGIAGIILQLFIYPPLQRHIGTLNVFRVANAIFPIAYISAPYLALLVDHEFSLCTAMAAILLAQIVARTMAIPSSILLLTDAAPHRSMMGTVHGAGNTLSALASACGPAIGGMLLAKGIEMGAIGLVWWTWLFMVSVMSLAWSFTLHAAV